uniref:Uncharacterized protein n=1 Tax=Xiphophorus couchianus TaxID=32473 RepID=A0A3B5LGR5_9TELE
MSIYQKFREVDILDKKKTVTAVKPGEDRAILLGLRMVLCSVMMYFVLGIAVLRSCADRYWSGGHCVIEVHLVGQRHLEIKAYFQVRWK